MRFIKPSYHTDQISPLNWADDLSPQISGSEASSQLASPGTKWVVAHRNYIISYSSYFVFVFIV